jgi:hypothetical protein
MDVSRSPHSTVRSLSTELLSNSFFFDQKKIKQKIEMKSERKKKSRREMTDGRNSSGELWHYKPFGCLHSVENWPIDGKRAETEREGRTKPTGVAGEEKVRSTTFEKKPWTLATSGRR